jgi:hypothetical protein
MKLDFAPPEIERSGKFKEANFDIGDKRVIFNILRSKMYSRPIYIICQEIMSNSRDANREVGRGDKPVEVVLPNDFSDQIQFRDNGPGISPDRMQNVYLQYGNSTKRSDNNQTGGFGLGAKTPFAYTDSFNIVTITNEPDGKRRKRTYIAYIDETQFGSVSMASEQETEEETGTTISMAVQKDDRDAFASAVRTIGSFWNPQPIVNGGDESEFRFSSVAYMAQGTGWAITTAPMIPGFNSAVICIDGIPYALRHAALFPATHDIRRHKDFRVIEQMAKSTSTVLYFKVGELAITANREDLDYQPEVIRKVHDRLVAMVEEARTITSDSLKSATNLWEASLLWNKMSSVFRTFGIQGEWNGKNVLGDTIKLYDITVPDPNSAAGWGYRRWNIFEGHRDTKVSVFSFDHNTGQVGLAKAGFRKKNVIRDIAVQSDVIVLEDEDNSEKPDRARVHTVFTKNPGTRYVAVVSFKDAAARGYVETALGWSLCGFGKLSSYDKTKRTSVIQRGGYKVYRVKKLIYKDRSPDWVPEMSKTTADTTGGVYVTINKGEIYIGKGIKVSKDRLWKLKEELGIEIYGFLSKWARKDINPAWKPLVEVIRAKVDNYLADPDVQHAFEWCSNGNIYNMFADKALDGLKLDKLADGPFKTWLVNSRRQRESEKKTYKLNILLELVNWDTLDFNGMYDKNGSTRPGLMQWYRRQCMKRYPMLYHLDRHRASDHFRINLTNYINSVDEKKEAANVASC